METDVMFVLGLLFAVLAVVSALNAWSESRMPRGALLLGVMSGALVYLAVSQRPGLYRLETIPDAVVRVAAQFL